jgi:hypothetical protein
MALLDPNTLIGIIQGKIGNLVFVRTKEGRVIVRHPPVRKGERTMAERANQTRVVLANAYVQNLRLHPDQYAPYQLAAKLMGKRACDLAKADFTHPPVIHDVDVAAYSGKADELLQIQAIDNFEVANVTLRFTDINGVLIEQGTAVRDEQPGLWTFVTQAAVAAGGAVVIHVTALDRAGNSATKTLQHALLPG